MRFPLRPERLDPLALASELPTLRPPPGQDEGGQPCEPGADGARAATPTNQPARDVQLALGCIAKDLARMDPARQAVVVQIVGSLAQIDLRAVEAVRDLVELVAHLSRRAR